MCITQQHWSLRLKNKPVCKSKRNLTRGVQYKISLNFKRKAFENIKQLTKRPSYTLKVSGKVPLRLSAALLQICPGRAANFAEASVKTGTNRGKNKTMLIKAE